MPRNIAKVIGEVVMPEVMANRITLEDGPGTSNIIIRRTLLIKNLGSHRQTVKTYIEAMEILGYIQYHHKDESGVVYYTLMGA